MATLWLRLREGFLAPEHQTLVCDGKLPRFVLIHGFLGTPAEWQPLAGLLHAQEWSVSAPLLPGFGQHLPQLPTVRLEQWLASLREIVVAEQPEATILVGFSFGGALALQLAAEYSPRALVLLAPLTRLPLPRWYRWGLPILERISDGPRPFAGLNPEDPDVRRALSGWNAALDVGDPVIVEELRSLRFPWRILRELDRTARAAFSAATRVRCPVWLVHARADQTVPVSDSRRLAARLPMLQGYFEPPGDHQLVRPEHPGYWLVSQLLVRLGSER